MPTLLAGSLLSVVGLALPIGASASVPQPTRAAIDRITAGKGVDIADDGACKVVFPREAATIVTDDQTLSPSLGLNSWIAFSSAVRHEAILRGQYLLTDRVVWHVVKDYAKRLGLSQAAPYDLRRSCAKLCHAAGRQGPNQY